MSTKKETSGRRSIQVEVEVPGTPEEVWQAIASGPGVSCWFVPCDIDGREGGTVTCHWGPGMDSVANITVWKPLDRFVAESTDLGPNAPPFASEWIVEARSGGTCVVRVVHSFFASTDDWDNQLESLESGWPAYFRILRLYLTHFRGQRCASIQVVSGRPAPASKAWDTLSGALGLAGAAKGGRWKTSAGAPPVAGIVENTGGGGQHHEVLLRVEEPAPGVASFGAYDCGGNVHVAISLYLYGDRAPAAVARDESAWQTWMSEHFPPAK